MNSYLAVQRRSGGHCETMVKVRGVFTRCGKRATDVHHKLTRSRGGKLLDDVGETAHLIHLCHDHHMWIHNNIAKATEGGLYLLGQVINEGARPVYVGPDHYLSTRYGREVDDQVWSAREGVGHLA